MDTLLSGNIPILLCHREVYDYQRKCPRDYFPYKNTARKGIAICYHKIKHGALRKGIGTQHLNSENLAAKNISLEELYEKF